MTEIEKLQERHNEIIKSNNSLIKRRLSVVTSFIQESNLRIDRPPDEIVLLSEEYNQYVLLELDTECCFQRFKINLFFEISIRKEMPKQIDFIQASACYDTLRRIIKRLECEGVKHHIFYAGVSGEDGNYFNYCVKLNDETCSKNDFFEAISTLLAFKIFESLFSFPELIFSPTDEEIDDCILKFWKIKQRYLDILINPIYKSPAYNEDIF